MQPVTLTGEALLQSDVCSVWSFAADTERTNRLLGLSPLQVQPAGDAGAARFVVRTRLGGFKVEWEDLPTEISRYERYLIRRRFRSGPLQALQMEIRMQPEGGGTRLKVALTLVPKLALLRPVARIDGGRAVRKLIAAARAWDAAGRDGRAPLKEIQHPPDLQALAWSVAALEKALPESSRPLAARLGELIRTGGDHELVRLRPFELAARWGVPREPLLHTCLLAVVHGLLELSWEAVCPSCRGPAERRSELADLRGHSECPLCDLRFELTLDEAVEATFTPSPALRRIEGGPFCISGPGRLPHVVRQSVLPADAAVTLVAPDEAGRYRLFIRGGELAALTVAEGGAGEATFAPGGGTLEVAPGAPLHVPPRGEETHVKLEHLEWASHAVTAHHLALSPSFRRLFARQALRPGISLAVKRVTLLFTDLAGSTALYSLLGDAVAFRIVQEHFDLLSRLVEEGGGTVVKTIGDAVMAAFPDESAAIRAGLQMHVELARLKQAPELAPLSLKLGAYAGPCYAVNANGVLDYFGQTVNIAARLQGAAGPDELVLPAEMAERARAEGLLENVQVGDRFEAVLKGLDAPLWAIRLRQAAPPGEVRVRAG